METTSELRLQLPRRLMQRSLLVAALTLCGAAAVGLWRAEKDIDAELHAALSLGASMSRLAQVSGMDDSSLLRALGPQGNEVPLRHLGLSLHDENGVLLLGPAHPQAEGAALEWLAQWHARWRPTAQLPPLRWPVSRPDGRQWTLTLTAAPESERREALHNLLGLMAVLACGTAALLVVMAWNARRALRPLQQLVAGIQRIRAGETDAHLALPGQPVHELRVVSEALQSLSTSLQQEQAQRRLLSQQVLTLQEDERASLARDLHDEWGQRLTAVRVDAAWLAKRTAAQPGLHGVVQGIAQQCEKMQQDIRSLLTRLQPLGAAPDAGAAPAFENLQRLRALLQGLVADWNTPGRTDSTAFALQLEWHPSPNTTGPQAWPGAERAQDLLLPRALVLALYRISQEALTNVARHAQAHQARIGITLHGSLLPGEAVTIEWHCADDGLGLRADQAAPQSGNGLAGIRERAWALGADLQAEAARAHGANPGLRLSARFQAVLQPQPPGTDPTP